MAIRKKRQHENRFVRFGKIDSYQKQNYRVIKGKPFDLFDFDDAKYVNYFCGKEPKYCDGQYEQCKDCLEYNTDNYTCGKLIDYEKQLKKIRSKIRKTFTLKDYDLIWHHFYDEVPLNEIEKRSGHWALTTIAAYKKAIGKLIADYTKFQNEWEYKWARESGKQKTRFIYGANNLTWPIRYYHFEVFIPPGTIK